MFRAIWRRLVNWWQPKNQERQLELRLEPDDLDRLEFQIALDEEFKTLQEEVRKTRQITARTLADRMLRAVLWVAVSILIFVLSVIGFAEARKFLADS